MTREQQSGAGHHSADAVGGLDVVARLSRQAREWGDDPSDENSSAYLSTVNDWIDLAEERLRRKCPPGVTVDEVRSIVLEKLWRRRADGLPRHLDDKPVTALLEVIFQRSAIDLYRRARRHRTVDLESELDQVCSATEPDAAVVAGGNEDVARIMDLVAALPRKQREVLGLRVDGLSPEQISKQIGAGGSSVRMNLHRARQAIRARL